MKKKDELKKLDLTKLHEELNNEKKELFKVRFDVKTGQSKNSHLIKKHKRQIARINTIKNNQPA